jgi:uroporphyrinogen III methyltransferase/synthase
MADKQGIVVLVGAGPGDPALITLEGLNWLKRAEVVVYDRLADPRLLDHCPASAQRVYVGKTPDPAVQDQQAIHRLLVQHAQAGRLVVRLKGGDPLIFGRGGEEADALRQAGVDFRIVPGVTAALAAAAGGGIPLTDRRLASSLALVAGREDTSKPQSSLDWKALAGIDTVVFYMGVAALETITDNLAAAGRDIETPAAIVTGAGTARQRTIVTTLGLLPQTASRHQVRPPALIIVGQVVSLREQLSWQERLPLHGRRIIVTRARRQSSELADRLAELGAEVLDAPAIEIAPVEDASAIDACLNRLGEYDLVAFTSANGVDAFAEHCRRLGVDGRALASAKVAAIGPATADELGKLFLKPDVVPETFTAEALGAALAGWLGGQGQGQAAQRSRPARVLLPRADIATDTLPALLRQAGAQVDEVAFYRTLCPDSLPIEAAQAIRAWSVDWIAFASSSCVTNFLALLKKSRLTLPEATRLAAIGPVTAQAIRQAGLTPHAIANPHTIPGLVDAILQAQE